MWQEFCWTPEWARGGKKQQITADIYQSLAIRAPVFPSVHKHCVDLITVAGHQLVPLAVKLQQSEGGGWMISTSVWFI